MGRSTDSFVGYHQIRLAILNLLGLDDNVGIPYILEKHESENYENLSVYCNLMRGPLGTTESFEHVSKNMNSSFLLLDEGDKIRYHNGNFPEEWLYHKLKAFVGINLHD